MLKTWEVFEVCTHLARIFILPLNEWYLDIGELDCFQTTGLHMPLPCEWECIEEYIKIVNEGVFPDIDQGDLMIAEDSTGVVMRLG